MPTSKPTLSAWAIISPCPLVQTAPVPTSPCVRRASESIAVPPPVPVLLPPRAPRTSCPWSGTGQEPWRTPHGPDPIGQFTSVQRNAISSESARHVREGFTPASRSLLFYNPH